MIRIGAVEASVEARSGAARQEPSHSIRFGNAAELQFSRAALALAGAAEQPGLTPATDAEGRREQADASRSRAPTEPKDSGADETRPKGSQEGGPSDTGLSEEEEREVTELKRRDREVRTHEQAHKSAGGAYAGAIHYEYERGPDAANYAVGGHVPIDVAPVQGDPAATIAKMNTVRRAALAPAQPSSADRRVAATASARAAEARGDLAQQQREEATDSVSSDPADRFR